MERDLDEARGRAVRTSRAVKWNGTWTRPEVGLSGQAGEQCLENQHRRWDSKTNQKNKKKHKRNHLGTYMAIFRSLFLSILILRSLLDSVRSLSCPWWWLCRLSLCPSPGPPCLLSPSLQCSLVFRCDLSLDLSRDLSRDLSCDLRPPGRSLCLLSEFSGDFTPSGL